MDSEKAAQFVGITGASESTAAFYLESCGGDAERAIQSFFDAGGAEAPVGGAPPAAAAPAAAIGPPSLLAEAAAARAARAAAAGGAAGGAGPSSSRPVGGGRPAAAPGNVRSLGDIGGEESEEDDDYNELYVGGDKRCRGCGAVAVGRWVCMRCAAPSCLCCMVCTGTAGREAVLVPIPIALCVCRPGSAPQRPGGARRAHGQAQGQGRCGRGGHF